MLPGLSKAEARVLGLLSYGIVLFNGCGITRLSHGLAKIEQVPAGRLRQRLREFSYEAEAKRGNKRREVKVEACFADLLRSVLRGWEGKKELALAMDASTLGERFTVLSISVMYRGCGIPIAWKIIPAMQEGEWRPYWEGLLSTFEGVVPPDWKVILMADRGLYAAWLYQAIVKLGWHPMLRVKEDLSFRATAEETFSPMGLRVKRRGRGWSGKGEWSEHGERMEGTVIIRWEKGYAEKLVVVTDLNEKEANAAWYQMRFWIEDEYKDHKSGGWGWEQTKMTDPGRAERQWLARAVAMQMAEEWPKQTYGVYKPTKSWVKKSKQKQAKKRYHKNKQARTCQGELTLTQDAAQEHEKKQPSAQPPKHVRKRERAKQEQEAKRLLRQAKREERKREQEEHRVQKLCEHEERKQEQQHKRERRLRAREEREQERLWRLQWHEQIKRKREQRLARKQERMARRASGAAATSSALSTILADDQPLASLPKPP